MTKEIGTTDPKKVRSNQKGSKSARLCRKVAGNVHSVLNNGLLGSDEKLDYTEDSPDQRLYEFLGWNLGDDSCEKREK